MRKYKIILSVLLVFAMITACGKKGDPVILPDTSDVTSIELRNGSTSAISIDPDYIENFMGLLSDMEITNQESINDAPSVDDYISIRIHCDDQTSEVFFYQKKNTDYVEQPYQGIYKPSPALHEAITELLDSLDMAAASSAFQFTFQATVLEVNDTNILVEPVPDSAEHMSSGQIYVPNQESVAVQTGDLVEITYDGSIMETYPAQLGQVYSIQIVAQE